jgi:hypothetical protein
MIAFGTVSSLEIVIGYVGAAATKSAMLGLITLATAACFVPLHIEHPVWMLAFLLLTCITFSLFGFIIGIWAKNFEQLQLIPLLIVTPLAFLGGSFYSIDMLPPVWRTISLANPVRLSGERLPLELLRHRRCQDRDQPHDHALVPLRLPRHRDVDLQDGLQAEELAFRAGQPASRERARK